MLTDHSLASAHLSIAGICSSGNRTAFEPSESVLLSHQGAVCAPAGVVPSATFETSDGRWAIIGGNGDSVYTRLMTAVGHPEMGMQNARYATNPARCQHEDEIYKVIELQCDGLCFWHTFPLFLSSLLNN